MSIQLTVGTSISIGSTYATAVTFTSISNASEAVITVSNTLANGDIIEITSGWSLLDARVVRVKAATASQFTLEGVDTADTTKYPAGSGGGSFRKITAFTQLSQLTRDINVAGGDQQYADVTTLDDRTQRQIPTTRTPVTLGLNTFFDPALGWVAPVRSASDASRATAVRLAFPGGSKTYGNAYWSLADIPTIQDDTLRIGINLAFASLPITYAT